MICAHCGNPFEPRSGVQQDAICPDCQLDPDVTFSQTTRPITESERASFEFPERFRPEEILGEGAFGIVSKCWDEKLRRYVAIKRPKRAFIDQGIFLREARAASQLHHPSVVQIFDVGEHRGQAYIVSELVDGGSLRAWLKTHQPGFDEVVRICVAIGEGVAAAHQLGIIHRDLKPGNILMGPDQQPRIADFGLSHSRNSGLDTLVVEGQPIGTPAFMAPEQVRGNKAEIGERSDIYSLGTVLYQMLTGRLPFMGSSREILDALVDDEPVCPRVLKPSIPEALEAICLKAMAKNAAARYSSARELVDDLKAFSAGRRLLALPGLYRERRQALVRQWSLPFLTAACLTCLVVASWWIWHNHRLQNPRVPVLIDSEPPEASVTWVPIDFSIGELAPDRAIESVAGQPVLLPPGIYKVYVRAGPEMVEVFRTVPESIDRCDPSQYRFFGAEIVAPHRWSAGVNGQVRLQTIRVVGQATVSEGMVRFSGGKAKFPELETVMYMLKGRSWAVGAFLLDRREVTWGDLSAVFPDLALPIDAATDMVATEIPFDIAVAYAEAVGKCLPTVYEMQFAATNGGRTSYPWGDEDFTTAFAPERGPLPPDWDQNATTPPVVDLYGGVPEWTETVFVVRMPREAHEQGVVLGTVTPGGVSGTLGLAPESWLTAAAGELPWPLNPGGFAPRAPTDTDGRIGFRTARRLEQPF